MTNNDPLTSTLAQLRVDPPAALLDRVVARWVQVPGPTGALYVASTDAGIAYVRTGDAVHDNPAEFTAAFRAQFGRPLLAGTRAPAGLLPALRTGRTNTLDYDLRGSTEFERAVLRAAQSIPKGQVRPYAWIANQIGSPKAVRAVGSALGRNPVPLLIPCHRVIRSDGTLGQYVFSAAVKRDLLAEEGTNLAELAELAERGVHYLGSDTTGVVCYPSCADARRITLAHRHGFRTLRQAAQAGYRPCQHCQPVGS